MDDDDRDYLDDDGMRAVETHIMELEAELSDARRRADEWYDHWLKDGDEHTEALRRARDQADDTASRYAGHMARLDRIATALERVAAALEPERGPGHDTPGYVGIR